MATLICLHYFVSGKVQGVWFRASAKEQADLLGITGWVRNLPDNRVEVLACGDKEKLAILQKWLHVGPKLAHIVHLAIEELPYKEYRGFEVL
ncbi:MAG: acylphosphatase [Gammaproteobacteria bacterium RIFCSPHIGHO2_12_FULL_37_14]|nr:MAG: acylphosphatase [Gammaproteobacteria bacterium RIFCSPHIGHO2_12_FULL_37_14]